MSNAILQQPPAVVLRSRYDQLRMLLVIALIAVVGLVVAVAIVASDDDSSVSPVAPSEGTPFVIPHK
jgi:hypothetical protein